MSDYDRGAELGRFLKQAREDGENPDIRYEIADEAKSNRGGFDEFMRGLNETLQEGS